MEQELAGQVGGADDSKAPANAPGHTADMDSLIGSVLHRLRTPLAAIKGWTHLARRAHEAELISYLDQTANQHAVGHRGMELV